MKLKFTLLIVLFFSIVVNAQVRKKNKINLEKVTIDVIDNTSFYIQKIIDNRFQKEGIGIVQKTLTNDRSITVFEHKFEDELLQYISKIVIPSDLKTPLIVRVNDLLIYEETKAFNENGYAYVYLDVFDYKDGIHKCLGSYTANVKNELTQLM